MPNRKETLRRVMLTQSVPEASKWLQENIHYSDFSNLKSPNKVIDDGSGSCHDQAALQKNILKKMGKRANNMFFVEHNNRENIGGATHTLTYYKDTDGKIYWLENSWGGQEGLHGPFNSVDDLKIHIRELHKKEPSAKRFPNMTFADGKKIKAGSSLATYVDQHLR